MKDAVRYMTIYLQDRLWIVSVRISSGSIAQAILVMWDGLSWHGITPPTGNKIICDIQSADRGVWICAEQEIAKINVL